MELYKQIALHILKLRHTNRISYLLNHILFLKIQNYLQRLPHLLDYNLNSIQKRNLLNNYQKIKSHILIFPILSLILAYKNKQYRSHHPTLLTTYFPYNSAINQWLILGLQRTLLSSITFLHFFSLDLILILNTFW